MTQYLSIKNDFSDALLLFQVGDFYELFFDDAQQAAVTLGIALTKRGMHNGAPIPLCGVPVHTLDHYVAKLIKAGFKIALCDQLEEAQSGKIVARGVTRVLTPGTLVESSLLDGKSASYLCTCAPCDGAIGLAFAELLSSQVFVTSIPGTSYQSLDAELARFFPDEVLIPQTREAPQLLSHLKKGGYYGAIVDAADATDDTFFAWARSAFITPLDQFQPSPQSMGALKMFYRYLCSVRQEIAQQSLTLHPYSPTDFLRLDATTVKNLELVKNLHDGGRKQTLFSVLDHALTPAGSRYVQQWILRPLASVAAIKERHNFIEGYHRDPLFMHRVAELIKAGGDAERVVGRIALGRGSATDYVSVKNILSLIPAISSLLKQHGPPFSSLVEAYLATDKLCALHQLLAQSLDDGAGDSTRLIKQGFDQVLDTLRNTQEQSGSQLVALERQEQMATGISSLKIRYNNVQGYYIEITKTHLDAIPARYKRLQTLAGRERYITPELQELQQQVMQANNEIGAREKQLFEAIKTEVRCHTHALRSYAYLLGYLDALFSLARVAQDNRYVKPDLHEGRGITLRAARHPVVEVYTDGRFIPNDVTLDQTASLHIITGPNMGGKSTFLRQVALNVLMAHIGSFVAASSAAIQLTDCIFTRIGSGDNLAAGKSTFLVEMEETAAICTTASERSLLVLDEIGRGTTPHDGRALAQAVVEYLHQEVKAATLFATHYHELALLGKQFPGIVPYYTANTRGTAGQIIFLYSLLPGVADSSFGIEVARLAGMPEQITKRAYAIASALRKEE